MRDVLSIRLMIFKVYLISIFIPVFATRPAFSQGLFSQPSRGQAAIIYSGFSLDKVIPVEDNSQGKEYFQYCLGIVESSPKESRKIYYSKREFLELTEKPSAITEHLGEHLHIDIPKFRQFLLSKYQEKDLEKKCVQVEDLVEFSSQDKNVPMEEIEKTWKDQYKLVQDEKKCQESLLYPDDRTHEREAYIIRTYKKPTKELNRYWKGNLEADEVRGITDIKKYLKLADKFLVNYKMVSSQRFREKKPGTSLGKVPEDGESEDEKEKHSQFVTRKAGEIWERARAMDVDKFSPMVKFRKGRHKVHSHKIDKIVGQDSELTLETDKDNPLVKDPFLRLVLLEEKGAAIRRDVKKEKQRQRLEKRGHPSRTQDPRERLAQLEEAQKHGPLTERELKDLGKVKQALGLSMETAKPPLNFRTVVYEPTRNSLFWYNRYVTDTLVDVTVEKFLDASLDQLVPMSKNRNKLFRLTKGIDGGFVLAAQIGGLAGVPFTGGLSVIAANMVSAAGASVLGVATSLAKKEPPGMVLTKAGLRFGHGMTEGQIPGIGNLNGFVTSLDDLRVAFKAQEYLNKVRRGKKGAVKVRWETLGEPVVLKLIRDRLDYLSTGLVPRGEFLYAYGELDPEVQGLLEHTVRKLHRAKRDLENQLNKGKLRYEYLVKKGKVPNVHVPAVVQALEMEERDEAFYSQKKFQREELWKGMMEKVDQQQGQDSDSQ